jgi:hypothetical protein
VLEASTQAAGVPGTAATWVAPTGTRRRLGRWGVSIAPAQPVGARTPCAREAREGRVRVFGGGAPRCRAGRDRPFPKKR